MIRRHFLATLHYGTFSNEFEEELLGVTASPPPQFPSADPSPVCFYSLWSTPAPTLKQTPLLFSLPFPQPHFSFLPSSSFCRKKKIFLFARSCFSMASPVPLSTSLRVLIPRYLFSAIERYFSLFPAKLAFFRRLRHFLPAPPPNPSFPTYNKTW